MERQWAPVFASAPLPSQAVLRPFLDVSSKLPAGTEIEPHTLKEFPEVIKHTNTKSPGLDGLPYSVWALSGASGARLVYALYLQVVRDGVLPCEFNESLLVFIPMATPGQHPEAGDGFADPWGFRPISLSKTLHKPVARGLNATLEKLAVHWSIAPRGDSCRGAA